MGRRRVEARPGARARPPPPPPPAASPRGRHHRRDLERLARHDDTMTFVVDRVVPILRIFDRAKAHEFYVDYLGCSVDWTHQFAGQGPTYTQVSRDGLVLHLSEHHGDGAPGQAIYVAATGVRDLHAELAAKDYPFLNPGIGASPGREDGACLCLHDPFGNTLRLDERVC